MSNNSNQHPLAKLVREFLSNSAKGEAISLKMLVATYTMDTTFCVDWLEAFHKAKGSDKVERLEAVLCELSPEYPDLIEAATVSVSDIRKEHNPSAKVAKQLAKDEASKQRKSAQNVMRSVLTALVELRHTDILPDTLKINSKNRLEYQFKAMIEKEKEGEKVQELIECKEAYPGLSFADLVVRGRKVCEDLGWKVEKAPGADASGPKVPVATATGSEGSGEDQDGSSDKSTFLMVLKSFKSLLATKDYATLPVEEAEELRQIEHMIITKTYANSRGKVDVNMLVDQYNGQEAEVSAA